MLLSTLTGCALAALALPGQGQASEPQEISALIELEWVAVEIQGGGIDSVQVVVRSLVDGRLNVKIPAGTYFVAADPAFQNMVCVRGQVLSLGPLGVDNATVAAAGANRKRSIPGKEQGFALQAAPKNRELAQLAQALDPHVIDYRERQAAVWIVSDDATDGEIATLRTEPAGDTPGGERVISQVEVVRGLRRCADAGIDVAAKAIWSDRWLLYAAAHLGQEAELVKWFEGQDVSFDTSAAALADDDPRLRASVCLALGQLGDARGAPALAPALIGALADVDSTVRAEAATALGRLEEPSAVEPLCALLEDLDSAVLQGAAQALGTLGDARAVEPLLGLLEPARSVHSGLALGPLIQIGDPNTVELLLGRFDALDERGKTTAMDLFAAFGDRRTLELVAAATAEADTELVEHAVRALKAFRDPADLERSVPALIGAAAHPDLQVQRAAVQTLGILGDPRGLDTLLGASASTTTELRQDAAWALSKLADPRARAALIRALAADPDVVVREHAAHGLAILPDPAAIDPLVAAFFDPAPTVRAAAAHALATIGGDQAIEALIAMLELADSPLPPRELAASTLRNITGQSISGLDPAPWRAWRERGN